MDVDFRAERPRTHGQTDCGIGQKHLFQINLAVIHGYLGNRTEAGEALRHLFALWPEARQRMHEILRFWFPCEDMAAIFADGLIKAGFPMAGSLASG